MKIQNRSIIGGLLCLCLAPWSLLMGACPQNCPTPQCGTEPVSAGAPMTATQNILFKQVTQCCGDELHGEDAAIAYGLTVTHEDPNDIARHVSNTHDSNCQCEETYGDNFEHLTTTNRVVVWSGSVDPEEIGSYTITANVIDNGPACQGNFADTPVVLDFDIEVVDNPNLPSSNPPVPDPTESINLQQIETVVGICNLYGHIGGGYDKTEGFKKLHSHSAGCGTSSFTVTTKEEVSFDLGANLFWKIIEVGGGISTTTTISVPVSCSKSCASSYAALYQRFFDIHDTHVSIDIYNCHDVLISEDTVRTERRYYLNDTLQACWFDVETPPLPPTLIGGQP